MVLFFIHYLISRKFEAIDEVMAKVQYKFNEVKIDCETKNSSKGKLHTEESR